MREEGLRKPMDLTSHPVCVLQPIFTSHLGPHWPPEVMSPSVKNGAGGVGKGSTDPLSIQPGLTHGHAGQPPAHHLLSLGLSFPPP